MKKYFKYFKYLMIHKKNVFIVCVKKGMFIHAFTHDLSKFSFVEFVSYAKHFYGDRTEKRRSNFEYGWLNHQRKNKHHWDYWVRTNGDSLEMPHKYIKQMLCDWEAMSITFGDTVEDFYKKNNKSIMMHTKTRKHLEQLLRRV